MLSFAINVVLLTFLVAVLPLVAGEPQNTTLRLDSPLVTFSPGWQVATFPETGLQFAFANGLNDEVQVLLPEGTTAVSYQGFKLAGGALYFACIDCESTDDGGPNSVEVDAHDSTENGTQPPVTLFSFTDLDPAQQHVLSVINLEDDRFNHTSQITFDSVVVIFDFDDNGNSTAATSTLNGGSVTSAEQGGPVSTITVTATEISTSSTLTNTAPGQAPTTSSDGTVATSIASPPAVSQSTVLQPISGTTASTSSLPATITGAGSASTDTAGASTASPGAGGTQSPESTVPSTQSATASPTGPTSAGSSPTGSSGAEAPTGTTAPGSSSAGGMSAPGASQSATGGATTAGVAQAQPSASPITNTPPNSTGTSPASRDSANGSTTGVSKPVIIVIALLASLVVLAFLGAVLFMMVRNQAARRRATDPEGTAGLMTEAAPAAVVCAPLGLAPTRPQNPFADTVPPDIPLDAPGAARVVEQVPESEPLPRPPPPPLPPKSPLRNVFNTGPSPWLNRIPRNSSPTSS